MKNIKNIQIRKLRTRSKFVGTAQRPRLSVHRTNKYIYAQLIDDEKGITVLSMNGKKAGIKKEMTKEQRAHAIGVALAKEALKAKIKGVVFDRGAFKYHGRIKALADGAREGGLEL